MNVNSLNNRDISFKGFLDSKLLKKSLEFAAENGTLFAATTTLALSTIRPAAILSTPKTDKKNKQVACAKSITSSINGYLIDSTLMICIPLSEATQLGYIPEKNIAHDSARMLSEYDLYDMEYRKLEQQNTTYKKTNQ